MNIEPPVPGAVLKPIRAPFVDADAELIEPPVLQPLNRLLDLTGETMRARLFVVQDEGGREACLRPDFTLAVANAHIEAGGGRAIYRYEGKAFRVSPPHAAHAEEFVQIGLEDFGGEATAKADGDLIALAWRAAAAGGRDDLTIRLGDMGLFVAFLAAIGVEGAVAARLRRALANPRNLSAELARAQEPARANPDPLVQRLAELPRAEAVAALEAHWASAQMQPIGGRSAGEIIDRVVRLAEREKAPRLTREQAMLVGRYAGVRGAPPEALAKLAGLASGEAFAAALAGWSERLALLAEAGLPADRIEFDAGFVRAFSYYDGFLFEIVSTAVGADSPVAAGGRYDSLLGQLSGVPATAVGCIVRPFRAWAGAKW